MFLNLLIRMAWFYWFYPPVARFYTWFWGGSGVVLRRFQAALPQPRQMQASRLSICKFVHERATLLERAELSPLSGLHAKVQFGSVHHAGQRSRFWRIESPKWSRGCICLFEFAFRISENVAMCMIDNDVQQKRITN